MSDRSGKRKQTANATAILTIRIGDQYVDSNAPTIGFGNRPNVLDLADRIRIVPG